MAAYPHISMVIGGASSGKSDFAERFVMSQPEPRFYIATAQSFDAEMAAKIAAHRRMRAGAEWRTIEAPLELARAVQDVPDEGTILIDCATLWLSNLLLSDRFIDSAIDAATGDVLQRIAAHPRPVCLVSNEVGHGIVPQAALARRFRGIQGRFNIRCAAAADLVVSVTAGLPLVLKGCLP